VGGGLASVLCVGGLAGSLVVEALAVGASDLPDDALALVADRVTLGAEAA